MQRFILSTLLILFSTLANAQSLTAQLSGDSARFAYTSDVLGEALGRLELNAGILYNDNDDYAASVGLQVRGENLDAPLLVSLGARAYYGNIGVYTATAVALGGDVVFAPISIPGFEIGAHFYIAPEPVSFSDAISLRDYGVRVGYQVIPLSTVYVGYQKFEIEIENVGDVLLDDGIVFGLQIQF